MIATGIPREKDPADHACRDNLVQLARKRRFHRDRILACPHHHHRRQHRIEPDRIRRHLEIHRLLRQQIPKVSDHPLHRRSARQQRGQRQHRLLYHLDRQAMSMTGKLRPQQHDPFLPGQKLLAVQMKPHIQTDGILPLVQLQRLRQFSRPHDRIRAATALRIRHHDHSLGIRLERLAADHHFGLLHQRALPIEHPHLLPGRAAGKIGHQLSLADQRAGCHAARHAFDHPSPGSLHLGESQHLAMGHQRGLHIGQSAFVMGHQAIQIQIHRRR